MSDLDFRPRFRLYTELSVEKAEQLLLQKLRHNNPLDLRSTIVKGHMVLSIPPEKRHFWSPQMDISIASTEEGEDHHPSTIIRCLLAPAPQVWTMFMFLYGLAGFALLIGAMIASSQYMLGYDSWGVWVALGGLLLGVAMFLVAQSGKGLAREEMKKMKQFVDHAFLSLQTGHAPPS